MKQRVGIARALSDRAEDHADGRAVLARSTRSRAAPCRTRCGASARKTGQTVFMITHDVDEAIYLADRIVLMTNGPGAALAEVVENPLPKERVRTEVHKHPLYYPRAQPHHRFPGQPLEDASSSDDRAATRHDPRVRAAVVRARRSRRAVRRQARPHRTSRCGSAARDAGEPHDPRAQARTWRRKHQREAGHETRDLTEKLLDIKREKGWTWKHICEQIGGMSPVLITGALLGQHKLTKPQAAKAAELFGLSKTEQSDAQRGADARHGTPMPPTDPLIYRFYELVMVNGPAWKALIEEEFGDGIMSAIDFDMTMERLPDPKGDRVKIGMSGKFLPFKYYGAEQGIQAYGFKEE